MAADLSSVGMMDKAYFSSKNELLNWLKDDFQLNLKEIEQCANGGVYLHIVDRLFPGCVPMNKVKWYSRLEHENVSNYKLLQAALQKGGIKKNIEVERVIRGKYQDNLELLQWFKGVYDRNDGRSMPYDPVKRRSIGVGPLPDWARLPGGVQPPQPSQPSRGSQSNSTTEPQQQGFAAPHQRLNSSASQVAPRTSVPQGQESGPTGTTQQKTPVVKKSTLVVRPTMGGGGGGGAVPPAPVNPAPWPKLSRPNGVPAGGAHSRQPSATEKNGEMAKYAKTEAEREFYFNKLICVEALMKKSQEERRGSVDPSWVCAILYSKALLRPDDLASCVWEEIGDWLVAESLVRKEPSLTAE